MVEIIRSLILILIGFSISVAADEWEVKGSLGQQLQYNDNISFSTISQQSVFGYLLTPRLQASRKTGVLDMDFDGQGDIRRYDDSRWDCENYNLGLNNAYRTNRSVFALHGVYGANCSYSQQITDTGILVPKSQSTNFGVTPSWTWQWTPLTQLSAEASYAKTSYSNLGTNTNATGYNGNETYSVNLRGKHTWSPRLSLNGGVNFSNIQYTGANASTQNLYGFLLGGNYLISQQWKASAGGGLRLLDAQRQSGSTSTVQNNSISFGYLANISVGYDGKQSSFSTGYSSNFAPSAIGQTLQIHVLFVNYSYRVGQNLSVDLASSFSRSKTIGGQSSDNLAGGFNRDYSTASVGLAWQMAKDWQLRGSYLYRWQHYPQQGASQSLNTGTAESNTVILFLNYAWDGIHDSR